METSWHNILYNDSKDNTTCSTKILPSLENLHYQNFYGVVKTRLQLENFTGRTVESIKQDFHATIYIALLYRLWNFFNISLEITKITFLTIKYVL